MKSVFAWIWGTVAVASALALAFSVVIGTPRVMAQEGTPANGQADDCVEAMAAESPAATAEATTAAMPEATPVADRCVAIESYDIYFEPNLVTIPANTPVTIALPNEGAILHNFSVTDHRNPDVVNLNISVDIEPGETKTVTLQAEPGTYYFYCNVPGHESAGMFGYLMVEEDAEISAETATVTPPAGS